MVRQKDDRDFQEGKTKDIAHKGAANLLANDVPALLWVDGLQHCDFFNATYTDFLGVKQNLGGYDWENYIHPADRDHYRSIYQQAFESQRSFEVQMRLRRFDGSYRWTKSVGVPRFDADQKFLGYVGCTVDINDLKTSEAALHVSQQELQKALQEVEVSRQNLHDKVDDLEKFYDSVVGRELKMIDLENKVKALESEVRRLRPGGPLSPSNE